MTSSDSQLGSQPGSIDIHGILQMLPHRYPFLLLDRVLAYELDTYLHAIKNVTINEPFFQGHFPARPVLPGVLILEAIAQSSAILASMSPDVAEDRAKNMIFLFAGIDNARFKRPVEPGDQLLLNVQQTHYKKKIWKYSAQATVEGVLAASADIIFTYKLI